MKHVTNVAQNGEEEQPLTRLKDMKDKQQGNRQENMPEKQQGTR